MDQGAGSVHVVCTLLMCCTLQLDTRCRLWRVRARDERQAGAALACVVRLPLPARRSMLQLQPRARNKCGWELETIKMRFREAWARGWSAAQGVATHGAVLAKGMLQL